MVIHKSAIAVLRKAFDCGAILDFEVCEFKVVGDWSDVQSSYTAPDTALGLKSVSSVIPAPPATLELLMFKGSVAVICV